MKIYDNIIENGKIDLKLSTYNLNLGYQLNLIELKNNIINKTNINIYSAKNVLLEENTVNKSSINIESCNGIILLNNIFKNNDQYIFKYIIGNESANIYKIFSYNNDKIENFNIDIQESTKIEIIKDIEKIKEYIKINF